MSSFRRFALPVVGLGCGGGGAGTIERLVRRLPGVDTVYVNPATETVYVDVDPDACRLEDVCAAVEAAGFEVVRPSGRSDETVRRRSGRR